MISVHLCIDDLYVMLDVLYVLVSWREDALDWVFVVNGMIVNMCKMCWYVKLKDLYFPFLDGCWSGFGI